VTDRSEQFVARDERDQRRLVHRLPRARLVDRAGYVTDRARGRRVAHVGFADAGFRQCHAQQDRWLHAHLRGVAATLVGLDIDAEGVAAAQAQGYEAHRVDCCEPDAVAALGLEPAEVVLAGEIIEHLDATGAFLDALHLLCRPDGVLVLTTPNAYGWMNPLAALAGYEVNHPDHVTMFTWRTLSELLARHGWEVVESATFVPRVGALADAGWRLRLLGAGARAVLGLQRLVARTVAPFVADGLIVVARPTRPTR
jgi:SAM-dependent methyltransferase